MRACVVVPALDAKDTVGRVIEDVRRACGVVTIVVDDGSSDGTHAVAREHGAVVLRHPRNRGKGAAIVTGLREAARLAFDCAVTVDADGQHPATSTCTVLAASAEPHALVLGVRDLVGDGAPRSNRFGNFVSNLFLSAFSGRRFSDTQCGLRRYPVKGTLALGVRARGYAFEAEVVLRAVASGLPVVEVPIVSSYPKDADVRTHFRYSRDPAAIVATVVRTVIETRLRTR
jgi:glycosyltransferase involved in cell wall biosynthesis